MQLKIQKLELRNRLIAAPLAGYSNVVWRLLVHEFGAALSFSEMVSVEGIWRHHNRTLKYLQGDKEASPFAVQLFGADSDSFSRAIEVVEEYPFDLLDINMGCPVKKVVKRGAGAALMKDIDLAEKIIKTVRKKYSGPLTVKFRSGWSDETINAIDFAKMSEDAGADAVIVHPRTWEQGFRGEADWKIIAEAKKMVSIPVIGSGDVIDKASAERMFSETGCDGIMIGRAAIGGPWIFKEILEDYSPTVPEVFKAVDRHIELMLKYYNEKYTFAMMRKYLTKYMKGRPDAKKFYQEIYSLKDLTNLRICLEQYKQNLISLP